MISYVNALFLLFILKTLGSHVCWTFLVLDGVWYPLDQWVYVSIAALVPGESSVWQRCPTFCQ